MNSDLIEDKYKLASERWSVTTKKNNSSKKYSLTIVLFIIGLIFVGKIKEESRILQKEINNLKTSINDLELDLHQATLDHEVITSPENITYLAKKHLETNLDYYKKNQIKNLNEEEKSVIATLSKKNKSELSNQLILSLVKKDDIKKNKEIYYISKKLPNKIRKKANNKYQKTKNEIKNFYDNPKGVITSKRARRWAGIQVIKAFLGLPIIPGK